MKIYLIRHVATEYNLSGIYMGRTNDIPISNKHATIFKDKIVSNVNFFSESSRIISSPAIRCMQTANLLSEVLGNTIRIEPHDDFMETDMGGFEGKTAEKIKKEYPKEFELWKGSSPDFVFPSGESYSQVQQRAYTALNNVVSSLADSVDLVIVTHVDIIKMLIFKILGVSIKMKKYMYIDNGSISCLEKYNEGYKVKFTNL